LKQTGQGTNRGPNPVSSPTKILQDFAVDEVWANEAPQMKRADKKQHTGKPEN
jgi:hypothetical protein